MSEKQFTTKHSTACLTIAANVVRFAKPRTVAKRPLAVTMRAFRPARGARIETPSPFSLQPPIFAILGISNRSNFPAKTNLIPSPVPTFVSLRQISRPNADQRELLQFLENFPLDLCTPQPLLSSQPGLPSVLLHEAVSLGPLEK